MKNVNTKAKRTSITVAAAIAATLAIGTVGAGATGSFNQVFGENFAGEKVNGVYAGTNVNVKTADAYSAEFLGISGERYTGGRLGNYTEEPDRMAARICEGIRCVEELAGAQEQKDPFGLIPVLMSRPLWKA